MSKNLDKPSREVKVLLLVTLHAEPNYTVVSDSPIIGGPALVRKGAEETSAWTWDPNQLAEDVGFVMKRLFPKGNGDPFYVKDVKQAVAE